MAAQRLRLAKEEAERRAHDLEMARAQATTAKAAADQVVLALPADQAAAHREQRTFRSGPCPVPRGASACNGGQAMGNRLEDQNSD